MSKNRNRNPLLLVDIDGVLNAFAAPRTKGKRIGNTSDYREINVTGFPITYRPEWAQWVEELAALSSPIWATMWQENAAKYFAPATGIGMGITSHIDFDEHQVRFDFDREYDYTVHRVGSGVGNYKFPGVKATVGDRPFCWIDDDLEQWQHAWARRRSEAGVPTLLVAPDPAVGLTSHQYAEVKQFLVNSAA